MSPLASLARLAVLALALGTACNAHPIGGNSFDGPFIRGISVPVPPPSLLSAPRQDVDVEGTTRAPMPVAGTYVFLWDTVGLRGVFVEAAANGEFLIEGFPVDLTDNCLEAWWQEPGADGATSVSTFWVAYIGEDDQSVVVDQLMAGCN